MSYRKSILRLNAPGYRHSAPLKKKPFGPDLPPEQTQISAISTTFDVPWWGRYFI